MRLKSKNLAQIIIVPTGNGGTNGYRYENHKKDLRENLQTLSKSDEKGKSKLLDEYALTLSVTEII